MLGKSEDDVVIRAACRNDVSAIMALERRTKEAAHWGEEQYLAVFDQNSPKRVILVGERESELISFLVARILGSEWELENIAVGEAFRCLGLGSSLMRALLDAAEGAAATSVMLEVRESNRAARALYQKLSFQEEGRRRAYYESPTEDAILYRLLWKRG